MNFYFKQFAILVICVCCAAYLRMFFPLLSYQYWPQLINQPTQKLIGALIGMPLFELLFFGVAYLAAAGSFLFITQRFFSDKADRKLFLVVGMVNGAAWYLVSSFFAHSLWRGEQVTVLLVIYSLIGMLYGLLFYQWIVRKNSTLA